MSYDLIIFEKSNMPTGRTGFLNWYDKKMECDDGQDISFTSEKLQKAFHALRNIFSPINGSFAPGNKVLSETPEMKKYLCDYFITEDMISLSFSYSIVEFAYNTVKRAAYFWMLVFLTPTTAAFLCF